MRLDIPENLNLKLKFRKLRLKQSDIRETVLFILNKELKEDEE